MKWSSWRICLLTLLLVGCSTATPGPELVLYVRVGGVAGLDDLLTLREDGTATLVRRSRSSDFSVESALLAELHVALRESDFANLRSPAKPVTQGPDLLEYTVVYQGHKVRVVETAVPDGLRPVIGALDRIIALAP